MEQGKQFILDSDYLLNYIKKDYKERFRIFESFNLSHFGETQSVNCIASEICTNGFKSIRKEWFQNTIYLPFENMLIPVPAEYDKILTSHYGDYHQFVRGGSSHEGIILNPDIPYDEYLSRYIDNSFETTE